MKVLQIYKDYYPPIKGGIEGHINRLANGLKDKGIQVEVLVSNTKNKFERENIDGILVTKVPQICRIASAPLNPTLPYWIRKIGKDADILHFHFPNPTAEFSYLFSGLKKKIIVTYHSDIVRQKKLKKLYSPFLKIFLKKAQTIIVASPNYLNSSKVLKNYLNKCEVIPYGVEANKFAPKPAIQKEIIGLRKKCRVPIILFVGRFRYYKGLDVLIKAMKNIHSTLFIIGIGHMETELRCYVIKEKLEKKVIFLGDLSDQDMIKYLNACDIFLLPSTFRSEAFGIVLLEAMSCGKPLICTELGTGTSFVNQHKKTGLVVPPNDVDTLARSINFLLANPEIRKKYGKAGLYRVKKIFSKEKMVDSVLEIYKSI